MQHEPKTDGCVECGNRDNAPCCGDKCSEGLECNNHRCKTKGPSPPPPPPPPPATCGDAWKACCTSDTPCASGFCLLKRCVPKMALLAAAGVLMLLILLVALS